VRRGTAARLMHTGISASPVWSADGRTVYFANRTNGAFEIWKRDAGGVDTPVKILTSARHAFPLSASPDSRTLAVLSTSAATKAGVLLLPLDGGPPRPIVDTPFDEGAASFSPDSTMLAYQSASTGRWEVYVLRIADRRQAAVSTSGGARPVWTRDGLFYQSEGTIVRAAVANRPDGPIVESTANAPLQDVERRAIQNGAVLQGISPDGHVFLVNASDSPHRDAPSAGAIASLGWLRAVRPVLGPAEAQLPR
jgi:Tol biopolymer transport system component